MEKIKSTDSKKNDRKNKYRRVREEFRFRFSLYKIHVGKVLVRKNDEIFPTEKKILILRVRLNIGLVGPWMMVMMIHRFDLKTTLVAARDRHTNGLL